MKSVQNAEIEHLVAASQKGESEAFGKLYDLFVGPIYRYVYYRVGSSQAEDLTELIFLKTWEKIYQYQKQERSFSSWLFRIAHNVVVDYYRSNHSDEELTEAISDQHAEADSKRHAVHHFDQTLLTAAMRELKDHYRQILILKYINDLSYEEIGRIMGRSQAALRILQYRALKKLKRILENMGVTEEST